MTVTTIPTAGIADNAVTAAKAGFDPGKIGQVVTTSFTGTESSTSNAAGDSFTDSSVTATITPTATSSKIFVSCQINAGAGSYSDGSHIGRFTQAISGGATTAVNIGATSGNRIEVSSGRGSESQGSNTLLNTHFSFVLSPSTTSAVTVTYQFARRGNGSATAYINRTGDDGDNIEQQRAASQITLMEVLA
tara:strand:- start:4 stop:576 length:573 start_codon:yes stop_codon:yes gene_type:complete